MFEIYLAVETANDDKIYRKSGCGFVLIAKSVITYRREFSFHLGGHTNIDAFTMATILALSSIKSKFRQEPTKIFTDLEPALLYKTENNELKRWLSYYSNLEIKKADGHEAIAIAKNLAKTACEEQTDYDSKQLHYEVS